MTTPAETMAAASPAPARRQQSAALRPKRGRDPAKHTYHARKKETAELQLQVESLAKQVDLLRSKRGLLAAPRRQDANLCDHYVNGLYRTALKQQQLALAAAQSAIGGLHPLDLNVEHRQTTLLRLRDQVIESGLRYLTERTRFLDPIAPYADSSRYTTPGGDYCFTRTDVTPFEEPGRSVRQVYDALQFFFCNMEISVTEALGGVMIRESEDSESQEHEFTGVSQNRLLSSIIGGVQVELNCVMFSKFFHNFDGLGGDLAVIVGNSVDMDELFPYSPTERLREDVMSVLTVRTVPRTHVDPSGDVHDERVVVVTRMCLVKLRKSDLPIPTTAMRQLHEMLEKPCDIIIENARIFLWP